MGQMKEHSKGRSPKPQSGKKEPKQDHGRGLRPATAVRMRSKMWISAMWIPSNILLKWGVQGKEATANWWAELKEGLYLLCVLLFSHSVSICLLSPLLFILKAPMDQKFHTCDGAPAEVTSSLSNKANASREGAPAAEAALPLSEPASTRAKPSFQVGKTF